MVLLSWGKIGTVNVLERCENLVTIFCSEGSVERCENLVTIFRNEGSVFSTVNSHC
jgi:hypothetical protein